MSETFRFKLSKSVISLTVVLWVALAAFLVFTIVDMATMSGFNVARLISVVLLSAVFSWIIIMLYKSNYKVLPDGVEINTSILRYKIDILPLVSVKYFKVNNKLVLNYVYKDAIKKHYVQIDEKDFQRFVGALKEVKPSIIYEEET